MSKKYSAPFVKNDIVELEVTSTGSNGEGIGRYEGMAVFIPAAAEGDRLSVRIVKVEKSLAYGRIESILEPSPVRVEADCGAFPRCGGCVFRHISYEKECELKLRRVCDAFERIGKLDIRPDGIVGGEPARYRNKAQYPCTRGKDGRPVFGFYAGHSHRVVECGDCLLQPREFSRLVSIVTDYMMMASVEPYNETTGGGVMRHLYLRRSWSSGEIMVCLVCTAERLPEEQALVTMLRTAVPQVSTVVINTNKKNTNVILGDRCRTIFGEGYITDTLLGRSFRISPLSFFQVNRDQAEKLYSVAAEFAALDGGETLLDMYCGAGTIGLTMADRCAQLIGVEVCAEAVEDAKLNARLNGIGNAEFICADAAEAAAKLRARGVRPDVVILDPPRKGCSAELLATVAAMQPDRIVYVSCDPATQARDLAVMRGHGYEAVRARAVDMFPRTGHVETVCLLSKLISSQHIEIDLALDELDTTAAEKTATYSQIQAYVEEHFGLKVSPLYIAQVKRKFGIIERDCYNKPKNTDAKQPKCPPEKERAITEALRYFGMIK